LRRRELARAGLRARDSGPQTGQEEGGEQPAKGGESAMITPSPEGLSPWLLASTARYAPALHAVPVSGE
jgi:hypothetical protein